MEYTPDQMSAIREQVRIKTQRVAACIASWNGSDTDEEFKRLYRIQRAEINNWGKSKTLSLLELQVMDQRAINELLIWGVMKNKLPVNIADVSAFLIKRVKSLDLLSLVTP